MKLELFDGNTLHGYSKFVLQQLFIENFRLIVLSVQKSVAARSKAWVCGRSLAGIAGSNPAGGMDACLL